MISLLTILAVLVPGVPLEEQPHIDLPPEPLPGVLLIDDLIERVEEWREIEVELAAVEEEPPPRVEAESYPPLTGHRLVIADCESGDRLANGRAATGTHNWQGVNAQGSSASGAFQFIDSTWRWVAHEELGYTQYPRALDAPPKVQIEAFDWLWANGGSKHWNASQSCWGGLL